MADNTTLDSGTGGDVIRTEDRGSYKTPVSLMDVGGSSAEAIIGDSGVGMPCEGLDAENAAASGNPVQIGGRYDSSPRTLGDGDVGAIALDADGAVQISDGGNSITIDGTVSATIDGSSIVKAEDATHNSGDAGVMMLGVRQDSDAALGGDGDYTPPQFDSNGYLKVNIKAGAGSGGTASTDDSAFTAG